MWTAPVPVSSVTKRVLMTFEVRGRKGCCAAPPFKALPLKVSFACEASSTKPVLAAKPSRRDFAMTSFSLRPSACVNLPQT
jgi:hypothetical protein